MDEDDSYWMWNGAKYSVKGRCSHSFSLFAGCAQQLYTCIFVLQMVGQQLLGTAVIGLNSISLKTQVSQVWKCNLTATNNTQ